MLAVKCVEYFSTHKYINNHHHHLNSKYYYRLVTVISTKQQTPLSGHPLVLGTEREREKGRETETEEEREEGKGWVREIETWWMDIQTNFRNV